MLPGVKCGDSGELREKDRAVAWALLHRGNNSSLGHSNPEEPVERRKTSVLVRALRDVLKEMEDDTDLFQRLLRSYPTPLAEVKKQHS